MSNGTLSSTYNKRNSLIKIILTSIFIIIFFSEKLYAQYPVAEVNEKFRAYTDSLKQVEYTNVFPIWGQKAYKKGFDIPYPTGVMVNYMYLK